MSSWINVKETLPPCNILVKVKLTNGIEALDFINEPINDKMPFQHYHVTAWREPTRDELNEFMKKANTGKSKKYVLITIKNLIFTKIITQNFDSKEEAFNKMKTELYNRLKIDNDEKYMALLENGVELSNAILNENEAYIYQDCGETYHYWKIIEV